MIRSSLISFGQYCASHFYASPTQAEQKAQHQQALLQSLSQHVADDDGEAIRALLSGNHAVEWTSADLMASAHSLLCQAIEHNRIEAFRALLQHLPLDVITMHTTDSLRTLPMLAAQAGHAEMIYRFCFALSEKLAAQLPPAQHPDEIAPFDNHIRGQIRGILDTQDVDGNTALIHAVQRGDEPCVQALFFFQASIMLQNNAGNTVLQMLPPLYINDSLADRVRNRIDVDFRTTSHSG